MGEVIFGRLLGQFGRLETWETSGVHVQTKLAKYWLIPRSSARVFGESTKCKPVKLNITLFIITRQKKKDRKKEGETESRNIIKAC